MMKQLLGREMRLTARIAGSNVFSRTVSSCFSMRRGHSQRYFHSSPNLLLVKPYILADIGEGITECQIISWSVKPGDIVQQFDPICEVQSDKASVEITSRYDGTIKALHYEQDAMAVVGQPLLDIDVEEDPTEQDETNSSADAATDAAVKESSQTPEVVKAIDDEIQRTIGLQEPQVLQEADHHLESVQPHSQSQPIQLNTRDLGVVTPGVRHMLKKLGLKIADIQGTGRAGRVLKEDVQRYHAALSQAPATVASTQVSQSVAEDKILPLTPTEKQMFKVMTRSITIPHFTYTHIVDLSTLSAIRSRASSKSRLSTSPSASSSPDSTPTKLSPLAFILKALSQAFTHFPTLNAHLILDKDGEAAAATAQLVLKSSHDIGIAVDTPHGLLVPVVRNVQSKSILELASEVTRLSTLAKEGRLMPADFQGATFTVSNIGSIGGAGVSPVIVAPQVGILGMGRARVVAGFAGEGKDERIVKKEEVVLSWAADHRVLDGATVARCAEMVGALIRDVDVMGLQLK